MFSVAQAFVPVQVVGHSAKGLALFAMDAFGSAGTLVCAAFAKSVGSFTRYFS
jgi:hypothetical protein